MLAIVGFHAEFARLFKCGSVYFHGAGSKRIARHTSTSGAYCPIYGRRACRNGLQLGRLKGGYHSRRPATARQNAEGPREAALLGLVEAAGIEPASANDPDPVLHAAEVPDAASRAASCRR